MGKIIRISFTIGARERTPIFMDIQQRKDNLLSIKPETA